MINWGLPGPSNNNSWIPETDSRDPETETGNLETEKRVHKIHDTLETELQIMPRSLLASTREADCKNTNIGNSRRTVNELCFEVNVKTTSDIQGMR